MSQTATKIIKDAQRETISVTAWSSKDIETDKQTHQPDFGPFVRVNGPTVVDNGSTRKWALYRRQVQRWGAKPSLDIGAWTERLTSGEVSAAIQALPKEDDETGEPRVITCGDEYTDPYGHEFWVLQP